MTDKGQISKEVAAMVNEKAFDWLDAPVKRVGAPEDIAEAVRWLLQDARYTTGQILAVDGGRLLNL
jgi:pteridine reductase